MTAPPDDEPANVRSPACPSSADGTWLPEAGDVVACLPTQKSSSTPRALFTCCASGRLLPRDRMESRR